MSQTVMISSTALDLPEHREQVRLACERVGFHPKEMMEHGTAEDANAIEVSLRMVEQADVYICILAYRYGTVLPGQDISITEQEYNRAVELGKPRLVFFMDQNHPVTPKDFDTGPGAAKLQSLKDRIGTQRVAAFFKSPEDLRGQTVEALGKLKAKLAEDAGEDSTQIAARKINRALSIPPPPEPFIAHPYVLLQSRDLVGRQAEQNLLTQWVTDPRFAQTPIFNLVAIGGMGKSALTWKWFQDIAPQEMPGLKGRMWWSFYEANAGFENFLNNALTYVSRMPPDDVRKLSWHDKEMRLLQILDREPHLLVLDGFERVLIAYNQMDAAHKLDDDLDDETANRVAGAHGLPQSAGQSFVGKHKLRQTTDPRAGQFLRKLTQVRAARVLITTRLYPSDLQAMNGGPGPGCFAAFLQGLSEDDAIGLWRAMGVSGSRTELRPIFQSVESHTLLIQALASEVATNRQAPGDFAKWRENNPNFDPIGLPLQQSRTHILAYALEGLTAQLRQVVETVVAFRMPASYETLSDLLIGEDRACADDKALDAALTELEDRDLIGWDRIANRYDAHPIVRGVVWNLAGKEDQQSVLAALESHFEPMETPSDSTKVESLADLAPAIERYNSLIRLGRYDDAFSLFEDRLDDATLYRLTAHRERIEWLERLFPDGIDADSELSDERAVSWTLNALAVSFMISGAPGKATSLYRRAAEIYAEKENERAVSITLSNLGDCLTQSGGFREAEFTLRRALILSRDAEDNFKEAIRLRFLGRVAGHLGDESRSLEALQRSLQMFKDQSNAQSQGFATAFLAERALLLGKFDAARQHADEAWKLADHQRNERDYVRAALHQGQAALGLHDLEIADERLHHALGRARAVNLVEYELPALVSLAKLALTQDDIALAREHLEDAWDPAERGPYPTQQSDAFNVLADIERAEGNTDAAIESAIKAYRAAWCDGPPYAYHWGLEAAKAHLQALGATEPYMPTFDESKFEPLPEVKITPIEED